MDKISFKVYLMKESSANKLEVRRFNVEKNINLTYAYIREKLQSIFPTLLDKNFVISWKDEIDDITISSTEELQLALKEMGEYDVINRLYATIQNEHEKDASGPSKIKQVLHPGIVCDVCDSNVLGFRFKCIQCPDYDLCMDCLTLGYHSEHYMVRMPVPLEWSSYQGRKLAHHMKKFMKKAAAACKEDERKHGKKQCPAFSSGKKFVFDPLELLSRIHNANVTLCQDTEQKQEQRRDQSAETATEATEDPQHEVKKPPTFTQLLKIFEDNLSNISQFLDPLGINVTVVTDDDTSKNTPKSADTSKNTPKPADSNQNEMEQQPTTSEDETKKFPGKGKKLCDDIKKDESSSAINNESAQKTVQPENIIEDSEWTVVSPEINDSRSSSFSSSGNGAIPKQVTPSAPLSTEPEKETKRNIYPSLMEQQQFFHPNPKIQQAVEAMMSMGFSNEGGWLTQLLVSKDGDIGKALDVLSPARPS